MPSAHYKHVTGAGALSDVLRAIPRDLRTKVLAKAVDQGIEPIKVAAKRFAKRSEATGALRESIDKVVRAYPHDAVAVGMVGPTRDYFKGRRKLGRKDDRRGAEQPSRRAHLIEYGHAIVTGGSLRPQHNLALVETGKLSKNGKPLKRWKRAGVKTAAKGKVVGWVPPRPFLRPAVLTTQNEVEARLFAGVDAGIEETRSRLVKEGAHAR
jgi:hypothetical protein